VGASTRLRGIRARARPRLSMVIIGNVKLAVLVQLRRWVNQAAEMAAFWG